MTQFTFDLEGGRCYDLNRYPDHYVWTEEEYKHEQEKTELKKRAEVAEEINARWVLVLMFAIVAVFGFLGMAGGL